MISLESGTEIRFPVMENARLARGTAKQLSRIELSPFGIHWPDLDEDLSFRGLLAGDYGQHQKVNKSLQANRRPRLKAPKPTCEFGRSRFTPENQFARLRWNSRELARRLALGTARPEVSVT